MTLTTLILWLAAPLLAQGQEGQLEDQARLREAIQRAPNNVKEAEREMERARDMRMENAAAQMYVAPYFSLLGDQEAALVLMSRYAEPFPVAVTAVTWNGRMSRIDNLVIQPRQRVVLDLRHTLQKGGVGIKTGSIRVEHLGDSGMLQSWIVYTNSHGTVAMPLIGTYSFAREATSFWALGWNTEPHGHAADVAYILHNRASSHLNVTISTSNPSRNAGPRAFDLSPDASLLIEPNRGRNVDQGAITFEHDGPEGQLAVVGLVLSPRGVITTLPVADRATLTKFKTYSSAGVARWNDPTGHHLPFLALYDARTEGGIQAVTVDLLEFETGTIFQQSRRYVAPGDIHLFDEPLSALGEAPSASRLRLRLDAEVFGIIPFFIVSSPETSTITEVELLSHNNSHSNGTYPLPSPQESSSTAVLLNVGAEAAEIFSHIVTDLGEYALDPFTIPAGGAYQVDFNALISAGTPDRIGRVISTAFESGFFQWMSRGPGFDLLARTNVSITGSDDVIGFNCFGCCEEFPVGAVYPDASYIFTGEPAFFEAQLYINNCAGIAGPYPANVTTRSFSSPVTWSGTSLSTTGETEQSVGFFGQGEFMWVDCDFRTRNYFGSGPVGFFDNCQEIHNPGRNGYESCQQQPLPGETCAECCDKQRKVGNCICAKLPFGSAICSAFVGHAYRNCLENCAL